MVAVSVSLYVFANILGVLQLTLIDFGKVPFPLYFEPALNDDCRRGFVSE